MRRKQKILRKADSGTHKYIRAEIIRFAEEKFACGF
jgi:hypothetical protein